MDASEFQFDGRVAIVTGAGNGLGREYALSLAARGASIVVNDLGTSPSGIGTSGEPARRVAAEIVAAGGTAIPVEQSVATRAGAEATVQAAIDAFGRIDILINNAGIVAPANFLEAEPEDYLRHINVGLIGTANMCRFAWPHLKETRGAIVNVSSSSIYGQRDLPAYAATKAAIWGFSRCIALDGARDGVRVNTLFPMGSTRTRDVSGSAVPDEETRRFVEEGLIARKNTAMVAYLAHPSCPVTGQAFATGSDRAALMLIGETEGFTKDGLSPEDIKEQMAAISDRSGHREFGSFDDYLDYLRQSWTRRLSDERAPSRPRIALAGRRLGQ